jgi:hypothetical protein
MLIVAIGQVLPGLAPAVLWIALIFLVAQQFITDPAWTILDITQVSYRQSITPDRWMGRTNASMRVVDFGGMVIGALLGGAVGDLIGLRATIFAGAGFIFLAAISLLAAPGFRTARSGTNFARETADSLAEIASGEQ